MCVVCGICALYVLSVLFVYVVEREEVTYSRITSIITIINSTQMMHRIGNINTGKTVARTIGRVSSELELAGGLTGHGPLGEESLRDFGVVGVEGRRYHSISWGKMSFSRVPTKKDPLLAPVN